MVGDVNFTLQPFFYKLIQKKILMLFINLLLSGKLFEKRNN